MQKLNNFANCLEVLKSADLTKANNDVIYRTGVVGQFNLTFELAWKALQETLKLLGVHDFKNGSPREVLQIGFKFEIINDSEVWLNMLGALANFRRNCSSAMPISGADCTGAAPVSPADALAHPPISAKSCPGA